MVFKLPMTWGEMAGNVFNYVFRLPTGMAQHGGQHADYVFKLKPWQNLQPMERRRLADIFLKFD